MQKQIPSMGRLCSDPACSWILVPGEQDKQHAPANEQHHPTRDDLDIWLHRAFSIELHKPTEIKGDFHLRATPAEHLGAPL
jgi:hypothetical protein